MNHDLTGVVLFIPLNNGFFCFLKPCFLQACLSHIKHHTVSSCLTRTSERIFARAAVLIFFSLNVTLTPTSGPRLVSLQPLSKWGAWLALEGQRQSVKGRPDEGLARTEAIFNVREPFDEHGSSSQPLRGLLDSISERIQQETRQMWNFPRPGSLPVDFSATVTEPLLLRSQMPFSIPARFRSEAAPWRAPWIQASLKVNLVGILTRFVSDLSERLVINIVGQSQDWRDLPSPTGLLGYFHLEKWAGQVLSFQIFDTFYGFSWKWSRSVALSGAACPG